MFGTMGFSELIIILVIILIIFGAGRLPQIGEGVGKALKGFKKEVSEVPPPIDPNDPQATPEVGMPSSGDSAQAGTSATPQAGTPANQPFQPGPEQTPGTTAAMMYQGAGPQVVQPANQASGATPSAPQAASSAPPPISMEERQANPTPTASAQYPVLPSSAQTKPMIKRPSAVVNKKAVARVQAQQAALKQKAATPSSPAPQDMQSLGEGLGSAVRTFRDAAADIQNSVDPQMRTIQAELEAAEKEMQESIEVAKQPFAPKESSGSS